MPSAISVDQTVQALGHRSEVAPHGRESGATLPAHDQTGEQMLGATALAQTRFGCSGGFGRINFPLFDVRSEVVPDSSILDFRIEFFPLSQGSKEIDRCAKTSTATFEGSDRVA